MPSASYFLLAGVNGNHFQSLFPDNGGLFANVRNQNL